MSTVDLNRIAAGIKMVLDRLTPKPVDNVIYDVATDKTMLKLKGNALGIDRVQCSFIEFDARSHKLKNAVDIYLDVPEALCFCQDIISGKIPKLAAAEKQRCKNEGVSYPSEVYTSPLGGVSEEKAKSRGLRTDGKAISRLFKLSPGAKADFIFTVEQRAGHTDPKLKRLIVPEGNPEITIRVACSSSQLKALALTLKMHIESFYAAKYATNGYAMQKKD